MAGKGLDLYSDVPLYEQLAAILREMIRFGELRHPDPLPSEARLSQEYDISRDTVRRAIGVLVDEGLAFTVRRRPHRDHERAPALGAGRSTVG